MTALEEIRARGLELPVETEEEAKAELEKVEAYEKCVSEVFGELEKRGLNAVAEGEPGGIDRPTVLAAVELVADIKLSRALLESIYEGTIRSIGPDENGEHHFVTGWALSKD